MNKPTSDIKAANDTDAALTPAQAGGAMGDAFTLARILITPLVMFLVWKGWQPVAEGGIDLGLTALASMLFLIAAITDIFDDYFGGASRGVNRKFGYLDDVADTVLVVGTLVMLLYVIGRADMLAWTIVVPAVVLIGREVSVGLFKGFELSRYGWPDNLLSNLKGGLSVLAVCLLLGSPWITSWLDSTRASDANIMAIYDNASPWVWVTGTVVLWAAAVFSILSAVKIFTTKLGPSNDV